MATTGETRSNAIASSEGCAQPALRAAVADHFAGRISPAMEAAMRAHLLGCGDCDARYRRHLLLARLDPRALPAQDRLGRGLGFRGGRSSEHRRTHWALALCIPVAALLLLALSPRGVRPGAIQSVTAPSTTDDFAARGGSKGGSSFWVYHLGPDGAPRLAAHTIGRADELAFAYSNARGNRFLMIFGVDEHRHVYWFHPGWSGAPPEPPALSAQAGPGPFELPEALRQPLEPGRLRVYAAFSDRPLDPMVLEDAIRAAGDSDPAPALSAEGVTLVERTLEVTP
jgi:hypothetical protein